MRRDKMAQRSIHPIFLTGGLLAGLVLAAAPATAQVVIGGSDNRSVIVDLDVIDNPFGSPAAPAAKPNDGRIVLTPPAALRKKPDAAAIKLKPPAAIASPAPSAAPRPAPAARPAITAPTPPKPPAPVATARPQAQPAPVAPPPAPTRRDMPAVSSPAPSPGAPSPVAPAAPAAMPAPPPEPARTAALPSARPEPVTPPAPPRPVAPQEAPRAAAQPSTQPSPQAKPAPAARPTEQRTAALPPAAAARETAPRAIDGGFSLPFPAGGSDLADQARGQLAPIVERLKADDGLRVQLMAYAAGDGSSSSQARRVSLSRALAVRSYLIEQGIRSTRMDVRALGDTNRDGSADRVDVRIVGR